MPAAQGDVATAEFAQRLQHEVVRPGADAAAAQNARFVGGVETLLGVELGPGGVVDVDEGVVEMPRRAVQRDDFVDLTFGHVAGRVPPQQAQLGIGIVAAAAHLVADDEVAPGNPVAHGVIRGDALPNLRAHARGGTLVRIHKEKPRRVDRVQCSLPLRGVVVEGAHDHLRAGRLRHGGGGVGAARIPHDHGVGPVAQAGDARTDVVGFVLGEDNGHQLHTILSYTDVGHQNALTVL